MPRTPGSGIILLQRDILLDATRKADDKGRVTLGAKYAGRSFRIIVIETEKA